MLRPVQRTLAWHREEFRSCRVLNDASFFIDSVTFVVELARLFSVSWVASVQLVLKARITDVFTILHDSLDLGTFSNAPRVRSAFRCNAVWDG